MLGLKQPGGQTGPSVKMEVNLNLNGNAKMQP